MSKENKCPYCGGNGSKIRARMASLQTHFTFGYGERKWQCVKCASEWMSCYAIPPKGHSPDMEDASDKIIEVGFVDGVRGCADPVVLKISVEVPDTPIENIADSDTVGEQAS